MDINQLSSKIIGAAIEVHKALGPGLLDHRIRAVGSATVPTSDGSHGGLPYWSVNAEHRVGSATVPTPMAATVGCPTVNERF